MLMKTNPDTMHAPNHICTPHSRGTFTLGTRTRDLAISLRTPVLVLSFIFGKQRRVVPDRFDDPESFGPALAEKQPVTRRQVLWPLDEAERYGSAVPGANKWSVDVNNGAGLRNGANVEHGLVLFLDGRHVVQNQDIRDELAVHFGQRRAVGWFGKNNHAFPYFFAPNFLESKGGGLSCTGRRDGYSFPFDRSYRGLGKLSQRVGANDDIVACVDDTRLDNARNNSTNERNRKGIIDMKFKGGVGIVSGYSVSKRASWRKPCVWSSDDVPAMMW